MEDKMCPMLMIATAIATQPTNKEEAVGFLMICLKDKCAWWTTYYTDTKREHSECAIASISSLVDLI